MERVSLWLLGFRLLVGLVSLTVPLSPILESFRGLSPSWYPALIVFGSVVLLHIGVEFLVFIITSMRMRASNSQEATPSQESASQAPIHEIELSKFTGETHRQIANWMLATSGVIIGLISRKTIPLTDLEIISTLSLGLCVVMGFIFISIFSGGVHAEDNNKIIVGVVNYAFSIAILNIVFLSFIFGIIGIVVVFSRV